MQKAGQRRKILFVMHAACLGGGPIVCLNIMKRLDPRLFIPVFAAREDGPVLAEVRATGTPCHMVSDRGPWGSRFVGAFARLIRREKIDLVHLNTLASYYKYAAIAARLMGRPTVWFVQFNPMYRKRLRKWVICLADTIVMVDAPSAAQMFPEGLPPNVRIVPNAVDTTRFRPSPSSLLRQELGIEAGRKVIGTVARLEEGKGLIYLLQAIDLLRQARSDFFLVLVGEDRAPGRPYLNTLEGYIRKRNLERLVAFAGPRHDIPHVMNSFDIFVLPTLFECCSLAILEAMACGLPVVATDVGGNAQQLRDGHNGILVPARNPAALADGLLRLLDDEGLRTRLGQEAQRRCVEEFSIERHAEAVQRIYLDTLSGSVSGR